jgi:hypothetical protein
MALVIRSNKYSTEIIIAVIIVHTLRLQEAMHLHLPIQVLLAVVVVRDHREAVAVAELVVPAEVAIKTLT